MGTVSAVNVVELLKVMKQKKQVESFGITIASFSIVICQASNSILVLPIWLNPSVLVSISPPAVVMKFLQCKLGCCS